MKNDFANFALLEAFKEHPVSNQINEVFRAVIKQGENMVKKNDDLDEIPSLPDDNELSFDSGELDIGFSEEGEETPSLPASNEFELNSGEELDLNLSHDNSEELSAPGDFGEISFSDEDSSVENLNLNDESGNEGLALDNSFDLESDDSLSVNDDDSLNLSDDSLNLSSDDSLSLSDDDSLSLSDIDSSDEVVNPPLTELSDEQDGLSLIKEFPQSDFDLSEADSLGGDIGLPDDNAEMSVDAMEKLKEIDAILDYDASQVQLNSAKMLADEKNLDEPLVSEDLNLDNLNFSSSEEGEKDIKPEKNKKKKKEQVSEEKNYSDRHLGQDLKEISGAYSGEMERMQATISNLRTDREELLSKIQKLEEEKLLQSRHNLTLRAELDEKKIELTIIRKKLNDEISELKDRSKLWDEKRLILEEKNRLLQQEVERASQKNKMDVKKIQLRERELEQKLELLKSDAETQIRHRDLKILELKRRIDSMEFDMESISLQEKRSVESRYELEDKLDKAIKTLRSAINVLEDEDVKVNALEALKKNIDM